MKYKLPFLIPALLSVLVSSAEKTPIIKIYAYSQAITRGRDPGKGIINENGTLEKENAKPGIHYLIYLEQTRSSEIKPEQIWIHGISHSINSVIISNTPVELEDQVVYGESKKEILVHETFNKVLQLIITGFSKELLTTSNTLKKLISSSELVVSYLWKGKRYYKAVKKIKMLEPIAAM